MKTVKFRIFKEISRVGGGGISMDQVFCGTLEQMVQKFPRHKRWELDPLRNFSNEDIDTFVKFESQAEEDGSWVSCKDPRP